MKPYFKITSRTFTIWLLTCIINGAVCGTYLWMTDEFFDVWLGGVIMIILVSLFFSAPGFIIFAIVMFIKIRSGVYERVLFRTALITGFILAALTSIILFRLIGFTSESFLFSLVIITSAVISIMLHFRAFINITPYQNNHQNHYIE